jgi:hypothetical protein
VRRFVQRRNVADAIVVFHGTSRGPTWKCPMPAIRRLLSLDFA